MLSALAILHRAMAWSDRWHACWVSCGRRGGAGKRGVCVCVGGGGWGGDRGGWVAVSLQETCKPSSSSSLAATPQCVPFSKHVCCVVLHSYCCVHCDVLLQAIVALPRILKPDETRLLWFYLKLGADALLLRGAYSTGLHEGAIVQPSGRYVCTASMMQPAAR